MKDQKPLFTGFVCTTCGYEQIFSHPYSKIDSAEEVESGMYLCYCNEQSTPKVHELVKVWRRNYDIPRIISEDHMEIQRFD